MTYQVRSVRAFKLVQLRQHLILIPRLHKKKAYKCTDRDTHLIDKYLNVIFALFTFYRLDARIVVVNYIIFF